MTKEKSDLVLQESVANITEASINSENFVKYSTDGLKNIFAGAKKSVVELGEEINVECIQLVTKLEYEESASFLKENVPNLFHIPYLPSFHSPGWFLRYIVGPYSVDLGLSAFGDFWAGITVAMTLIPQGLSYAVLANLPAINGLYTTILPLVAYVFFGSSLQLGVGPVALVSLIMGSLVNQYNIDYVNHTEDAVDFAQETAIAVGLIFCVMSILNLGGLIRYISFPVMSGFTTAAAMLIGANQLKNAFGFTINVPQTGQKDYPYNYQIFEWYANNFNGKDPKNHGNSIRNPYAETICFCLYFPLIIIVLLRNHYKETPQRKKSIVWNIWNMTSSLAPLIVIVIAAHVAYEIKKSDHFVSKHTHHNYYKKALKIVGIIPSGLNILRIPNFKWSFTKLLGDAIPISLVAFMESYSVAHRIATTRNELHILNASQELWALGVGNFLGGISSSYPAAGSFSRSSLNAAAGAKTPASKTTTIIVIVLSLQYLTKTFQYIPQAALAAIIFAAIFNLISITDFWEAWKHNKKDFFTMLVTFTIVFVFNTGIGILAGVGTALFVVAVEMALSFLNAPLVEKKAADNYGIDVLRLHQDLNFVTLPRFIDIFTSLTVLTNQPVNFDTANDRIFNTVSSALDSWLRPKLLNGADEYPKAVAIDFSHVHIVDMTALITLQDCVRSSHSKKIKVIFFNVTDSIAKQMIKFGIKNGNSENELGEYDAYLDQYLLLSQNMPVVKSDFTEMPVSILVSSSSNEKKISEGNIEQLYDGDGVELLVHTNNHSIGYKNVNQFVVGDV